MQYWCERCAPALPRQGRPTRRPMPAMLVNKEYLYAPMVVVLANANDVSFNSALHQAVLNAQMSVAFFWPIW